MKKILLLLAFAFVGLTSINAQHEVKLNALGLTFSNYAVGYEYILNEKAGINVMGSYFSVPSYLDNVWDLDYTSTSISAEYRFYFSSDDDAASGFWAAPYVKYNRRSYEGIPLDVTVDTLTVDFDVVDIAINKVALGVSIGSKRVAENGITFGWYIGMGRNLINTRSFSSDISDAQDDALDTGLGKMQYRLGLNVGYRFGEASGSSSKRRKR